MKNQRINEFTASIADAIQNVRDGKTLSGLCLEEIGVLQNRSDIYLDGYSIEFWDYFYQTFGPANLEAELAKALATVQHAPGIGDFIGQPCDQLTVLAAFGLVQIDRLARLAVDGGSGWDALYFYDQITECHEYVHHYVLATFMPDSAKVAQALLKSANRRAAYILHEKKQPAREFVQAEWTKHCSAYQGNKSAFARDYVRRVKNEFDVSITEKTVREVWLADTPDARIQAG